MYTSSSEGSGGLTRNERRSRSEAARPRPRRSSSSAVSPGSSSAGVGAGIWRTISLVLAARARPRFVSGRASPRLVRRRPRSSPPRGLGRRVPSLVLRRALALVLIVASGRTAAPTAPASSAPRAGTLLIGVALVIGAILVSGCPASLGNDRVDQMRPCADGGTRRSRARTRWRGDRRAGWLRALSRSSTDMVLPPWADDRWAPVALCQRPAIQLLQPSVDPRIAGAALAGAPSLQ